MYEQLKHKTMISLCKNIKQISDSMILFSFFMFITALFLRSLDVSHQIMKMK